MRPVVTSHFLSRPAILLISSLPFILFWRWLWRGEVLYWGTLLLQFWPWHQLVKESWLAGQWPLWNPLLGNGAPLLANMQSAALYPPNLLLLPLPTEHALTLSIVLHLVLAGLTMYFYSRRLAFTPFGATVSALAFMFSGYLIGRTQFPAMVHSAAWYPLLLLLTDRLACRRQWPEAVGLAMVLALQFLAGHAQLWFYGLWLVGAYTLFRTWPRPTLPLGLVGLAVGLSLLLAAGQLLPTTEYVTQSPRASGAERYFALTYSFWPWRLITLIAPDFFGNPAQANYWGYANYWEDHAYLGVLPLIFGLTAVWHWLKNRFQGRPLDPRLRTVPFFAGLVLLSLLLALGWNSPIYLLVFEYVPGFSFFQAPARLLIWYTVAMAVLAGAGAELFIATAFNRPHWRRFLAACVAITLAGLGGAWLLAGRDLTFLAATRNLGLFLIASVTLLLIQPSRSEVRPALIPLWQSGVALFIAFDLLLVAWPLLPMAPSSVFQTASSSAKVLKAQPPSYRFLTDKGFAHSATFNQYFRFSTFGPSDPIYLQSFKETLAPNLGVLADLPSANNNDPLVVGRQLSLIDQFEVAAPEIRLKLLALMNVGYYLNETAELPGPVLYNTDKIVIQQVPNPLPRAYYVSTSQVAPDPAEALQRLLAENFDPRREIVMINPYDDLIAAPASKPKPIAETPVVVEEKSATALRLRLEAPQAGFVVLTDTFYPGWQATVNGVPTPIFQANVAFRAVPVKAGAQEITFDYRPQTFTFGLWTSLGAWLIMLGILLRRTKQR
ncbi:MAG TPA: YfhO family protein [Anaerolineae bacterium]|nr:YfhO family protein [Anaerolineae bacterium]